MKHLLVIIAFSFILPFSVKGQDQKTLEKKRKKLETEIEQTQKAIQQTQKNKESSLKEIVNLEKQIELRKELIGNTSKEVKEFESLIQKTLFEIEELKNRLNILRQNYAQAIYGTYKSYRLADQLMFIANSHSFSDAMRRLNYLRKVGDYRKAQVDTIIHTQDEINSKLVSIQEKKDKQVHLLNQQKKQESELNKNKTQKAKLVDKLSVKESNLNKALADKKKESAKLSSQIQAIIAKEIEKQRKLEEERKRKEAEALAKAEKEAATKGNTPVTTPSKPVSPSKPSPTTPEVDKLSQTFAANKGRIPWPVERGSISRGFGPYKHPVYGGDMDNKGIDIKTDKNANVRAVFEGKVISIISNPIYKNAIIISHGDYFTVYTKLESVNVSKGQVIKGKQVIGKVYTDEETNETELHFEIWQKSILQNPALWIAR
ncbi:MAG: peptidoglycan DD-metalloendopeptidase family protein [Chitinophagales bacterium]|nr:peptidoglycan DD-metalloendopeptidase family protein [Chitinophagales bacterium]MCZ2392902.1 peptidoglycan DD-metalloendopeptidase family protein [Chitinophagales bacterium]